MVLNRSLIPEDEEEEEEEKKKNIIEETPTRDVTTWLQMIPQNIKDTLGFFLQDMTSIRVRTGNRQRKTTRVEQIKKEINITTSVEDIRDALEHYVFCEL